MSPVDVPVETAELGPFSGYDNDVVRGKCWNIDDAGNISESASEFEAVLLDTFPPPAPGVFGVRVVGETPDSTPYPDIPEDPDMVTTTPYPEPDPDGTTLEPDVTTTEEPEVTTEEPEVTTEEPEVTTEEPL
jgi:hypothetical protein